MISPEVCAMSRARSYLRHMLIRAKVIVLEFSVFNTFVPIDYAGEAGENTTNDKSLSGRCCGIVTPCLHSVFPSARSPERYPAPLPHAGNKWAEDI